MPSNLLKDSDHYNELVARQVDQYKETEVMHDLPGIYNYWVEKYTTKSWVEITGYGNIIDFYSEYCRRSLKESGSAFLLSVGSGDCSIEIEIVKKLLMNNREKFFFICLELSPILVAKARNKIDREGLGDVLTVAQIDINQWKPKYTFAAVMAHHSLHHILDLEHLFTLIKENLAPKGRFITCDMIGRNGHMRWPESLKLIREIWKRIPRKYKFNHQAQRYDDYFDNWDCSIEGFEGIRAQDILPLLVKNFSFEVFYSYGSLIDPFIDRAFGPNYDPENKLDTAFIDYVHVLNERLISEGILKPTFLTGVMTNEPVASTKVYKNRTPEFSIRDASSPAPEYDVMPLLKDIPFPDANKYAAVATNPIEYYTLGDQVVFCENHTTGTGTGIKFFKYGWATPESDFTWSITEDAALIFPLKEKVNSDLILNLKFIPYHSMLFSHAIIEIRVNDIEVTTLKYDNKVNNGVEEANIRIPAKVVQDTDFIEVIFMFPCRRQPQFEPGSDIRALGIALISSQIVKDSTV